MEPAQVDAQLRFAHVDGGRHRRGWLLAATLIDVRLYRMQLDQSELPCRVGLRWPFRARRTEPKLDHLATANSNRTNRTKPDAGPTNTSQSDHRGMSNRKAFDSAISSQGARASTVKQTTTIVDIGATIPRCMTLLR